MKNWLEYVEDSFVRQPNGSVSLTVRACKWLNADRICMVIETLLGSGTGFSVQILITSGEYRIYLDKKYSAHTVNELNDFISKKLWPYDESRQVLDEKFDKAFAKQEKARPDGTGYTADLAYNGLWVGLVRVSGEIDEHDFLVVSVLGRSVLEAALGALHRSYRAVKAMPTVAETAMPLKLSLKGTNFDSPYATAYVIKRDSDNAWISADGMIRRLNDLITREASNFGAAYARRLQDRGGSNGPVWYRSVEAAKFFMELNVEPVAPKQEKPKHEAKRVSAGDWAALLVDPAFSETRFTVVTPLPGQVLEEALGAMHRSSFAVLTTAIEATPKILKQVDKGFLPPEGQAAVDGHTFSKDGNLAPSIFVLERKDTHTWLKAAEVVKKLNAFIDVQLGNGLIKFITEYGFRPDRGDYKWYRHEKTASWFKALYRDPSRIVGEDEANAAGKPRKWIEFIKPSDNDARMIDVETSLGTLSLVNAAICAYMKAVGYNARAPRLIGCPAAFSSGTRIFIRFGDDWREGEEKNFIDGLNAFVEKALGPDPANPTVKPGYKTGALWKLAEEMRGQKKDQSGFTVIGGKILDKGDSSPYHQPCCSGYGFDLRFSKQLDNDFREKALDVIRLACKECRPAWLKKGDSLTFYEIRPEKTLLDIEILPWRSEWPSEAAERQVRDACLRKIMEIFGAAMDVIEPSSGPKKPEAKKPEAKRTVWGAGSGSLFEDAG